METLGLYLQIPFCASKCSFCNFSSKVSRAEVLASYCTAVEQEVGRLHSLYDTAGAGARLLATAVDTIYIGGGTPPIIGIERLEGILRAARTRFQFQRSLEFTLEITPGSAEQEYLKRARSLGVNRLSIGAQSFDDRELSAVGRLHSAADTRALAEQARRAGFENISLDLIAGLPHQTEDSWHRSLEAVGQLRPEHVSVYIFEVDEKSRLGGEVLRHGIRYHAESVPDDEFMAAAYETAQRFLKAQGYIQYEISNFALPGFESRHNRKYWNLEPYIGLGAGAHSFDGERRWANESAAETYTAKLARGESPIVELRRITPDEQVEEFFFLGLRQTEGIRLSDAHRRWGKSALGHFESVILELVERDLLVRHDDRVRLAYHALLVSNEIFQEFLVTRTEAP